MSTRCAARGWIFYNVAHLRYSGSVDRCGTLNSMMCHIHTHQCKHCPDGAYGYVHSALATNYLRRTTTAVVLYSCRHRIQSYHRRPSDRAKQTLHTGLDPMYRDRCTAVYTAMAQCHAIANDHFHTQAEHAAQSRREQSRAVPRTRSERHGKDSAATHIRLPTPHANMVPLPVAGGPAAA